jgi:hypothetical protein
VIGKGRGHLISIHAFKSAIEYWLHILKSEDTLLYKAYETNRSLPDSFATIQHYIRKQCLLEDIFDFHVQHTSRQLMHKREAKRTPAD